MDTMDYLSRRIRKTATGDESPTVYGMGEYESDEESDKPMPSVFESLKRGADERNWFRELCTKTQAQQPTSASEPDRVVADGVGYGNRGPETRSGYVCRECHESVQKGVSRCPHCGYNPAAHDKWERIHAVAAVAWTATIIGAPLGAVELWQSHKHGRARRKGVAKKDK